MKRTMKSWLSVLLSIAMLMAGIPATALGSILLPRAVTEIEAEAFAGDSGLTELVIPATVQKIGSRAFAACVNLQTVTFEGTEADIAKDAFEGTKAVFEVFAGSKQETYAMAHGFEVRLLSVGEDFSTRAMDLVLERGEPDSVLQGETFASERLLVQMDGNTLPDVSDYEPSQVFGDGKGFFVLQFESIEQTTACYHYLQSCTGLIVEPDSFLTVTLQNDETVSGDSLGEDWADKDPMGMQIYAEYIMRKYPHASATVAVIDTGVAMHSALNGHVIKGFDFTGQNNPRFDSQNHGTPVAGCIVDACFGANVKILPIRIFSDKFLTSLMLRMAVDKAISCRPDVINISAVFKDQRSAIVENRLQQAGIPVVVAAGNGDVNGGVNCDGFFPAGLTGPNVITVSSLTTTMTRAEHSNFGNSIDYCAPGTNIVSYTGDGGTYAAFTGTSYAAPQIAAAIALLSMDPEHGMADLKRVCKDLGEPGKDIYYGYGLPDMSLLSDTVRRIQMTNEVPDVMSVGETTELTYEVLPEGASNRTVTVAGSDPAVLGVSPKAEGVLEVTAQAKGISSITITANDGSGVSVTTSEITVVQPVTQIKLYASTNQVNLATGETLGLTATVLPTDANNRDVKWSSADEKIATVAQNGVVTPLAVGKTVIRADAADGYGAYDEFEVEVIEKIVPVDMRIAFDSPQLPKLKVGESGQLRVEVEPENAVESVSWNVINKDVLTVDTTGCVMAKAPGRAYVIATSTVNSAIQASCELIVIQPPTSIEISQRSATLDAGKTMQLTATVLPENAEDTTVVWRSSAPEIAMVDAAGVVSAIKSGTAVITASAKGDSSLEASCMVTVQQLPVQINVTGEECIYIGSSTQLTATVLPENADDRKVTWSSSKPDVASVTQMGLVQGLHEGVTTITVQSNAVPALTATLTVKVIPEWNYSDWTLAEDVPANAVVTDTKWTYTETTAVRQDTLDGWSLIGSEWKQTDTGSVRWVDFSNIPGFDTSNSLYKKYHVSAPTASESTTSKRTVTTAADGYLYWHWMYDCGKSAAGDRSIFYKKGTGTNALTGNTYGYSYFGAFESSKAYAQMSSNWGQDDRYYLWYKVTDRTSYAQTQGSYYYYRTQIQSTTYTDYEKQYIFQRNMEVTTEPTASAAISNVQKWVKYKTTNNPDFKLSGWIKASELPEGATVAETAWRYTETTTSGSPSLEGWTQTASDWAEVQTGSVRWADFSPISGFNHSNSLYVLYNQEKPVASTTENSKRTIVSETADGYIYWHWMYNCGGSVAADRAIFYKRGTGSSTLTGNTYGYSYFGAFESQKDYPQLNASVNWGQDDRYYLWYKVTDRTSYVDSQGSLYWYRTQLYKTMYTDYSKVYTYVRTVQTSTKPQQSENISDLEQMVRYY